MKTETYKIDNFSGRVLEVGGYPPQVVMQVFGGGVVQFAITEAWAKTLVIHLYEQVTLKGDGLVTEKGKLKNFTITEIIYGDGIN